ncbi:hypothetical protein PHLCEN_2v11582 [Hermanssonia centrifuga]|uniref:HSF-type DNA-binding domain-containing protein n=1 Tax=Hermanssonia centrifuga TaxID=98765 RepID=A0A2R6NJN8_9APHY|nr:hypothetical protein PHLCEN_2v11582 [Hermanssonia centrifuga]
MQSPEEGSTPQQAHHISRSSFQLGSSDIVDQPSNSRAVAQYPTPPTPTYSYPSLSNAANPSLSAAKWPVQPPDSSDYQNSPPVRRSNSEDELSDREASHLQVNLTETPSSASDFVKKLYRMLDDPALSRIVSWGPQGDCFVVKDVNDFTVVILPRVFKHSNFASFVRQLNKYDFHKVKDVEDTGSEEPNWTFRHPYFRAGGWDVLEQIKRKVTAPKFSNTDPAIYTTVDALRAQAEQIAWRQDEMAAHIENLQNNYQEVVNNISGFQRDMGQQDVLMRDMIQYFLSN